MTTASQSSRFLAIDTPLGEDVLLLQGFAGHEEMSRLFEFNLDLLSNDFDIDGDTLLGHNVTVRLDLPEGGTRYWNGFINRFSQGASASGEYAQYRATMVPWTWFLTRTSDFRIFQDKTVPQILRQIFADLGYTDIEDRLSADYRTWAYCVQYRETDFNFVSRLMEQEGIYTYFKHEQGKHTLVLCDSLSRHDPAEHYETIRYDPDVSAGSLQERITSWTVEKRVVSGKFTHTDYNFTQPKADMRGNAEDPQSHGKPDYEMYDFPGEYGVKAEGDRYARVRMEELSLAHELHRGQSESRGLCPGATFQLEGHASRDGEYLTVAIDVQAASQDYETGRRGAQNVFRCAFRAMSSANQFRPDRLTPKPVAQGPQTALVVGPAGEDIWPDEYGRVKVQFYWDREGRKDENSSCWIRVSTPWAGTNWGAVHIPRIGHEVVVSFLDGDPDQPLITGSVYNADNMPPYALPANKTRSGIKTRSSKGGSAANFNEVRFEDKKGSEELYIHAEKDQNTVVENNQTLTVGVNQKNDIGSNQDTTVGANRTLAVGANDDTTVTGNRTVAVTGNDDRTVAGNRSETTAGNVTTTTAGSATESTSGNKEYWNCADEAKGTCGFLQELTVGLKSETKVGGFHETLLGAKVSLNAAAEISVVAGAKYENDKALRKVESPIHKIEGKAKVDMSAPQIKIDGKGNVSITSGGSHVLIKPGQVSITTGTIWLKGDVKVTGEFTEMKGASVK